MIEINLDSKDRKNNKIIIDGEDICKKYYVTGFNLNYNAKDFLPIVTVNIYDEDIKIFSDNNEEPIINKTKTNNSNFYLYRLDGCILDFTDDIENVEYSYKNGIPSKLNITVENNVNMSKVDLEKGQKIEVYVKDILQYEVKINEIILSDDKKLLNIICL